MPHNSIKEYFEETFLFGGELKTRKQIIDYLKSIGGSPAMIDRYLQGLDQNKQINSRKEN